MKADIHQQIQELIATGEIEKLSGERRARVQEHLDSCEVCRGFGEAIGGVERALHSVGIAAGAALVSSTRARVHHRAVQLEQQQQRLWMVSMGALLVVLSTVLTTPVLFSAFAWMGNALGLPDLVWKFSFVWFWTAPALLVSVLLSARGAHWTSRHSSVRG
ncbi:MAG: zf-HC2 domain-containing protein [Acidobacteriales bacterium]|nr:zf-HC2 domain-containing protein [Terriglobales bacterium]